MAKMKIQVPIKPEPLQDPPAPMNDPIPEATKEPLSNKNEHSLCLGCRYAFVVRSERGDDIETEVHCTHPVFEHPHHMMDVVECDGFVQGSFAGKGKSAGELEDELRQLLEQHRVEKALTPEQKLLEKELSDLEEEGKALNSDESEGEDDDDEEGEGDEDRKPSKSQLSLEDLDDKAKAKDPKEVKKAMGDEEEDEEESEEDEEEAEEEDDKPQGPVPPGGSQDDE